MSTAVANGDLTKKITVEAKGEVAALADTINSMTDTLQAFADEVTRVAREVGTEGMLGGQAEVRGRGRHVEGPHRLGEHHGLQPHRPGARHRPGHHRGGQRRPDPEDHRDVRGEILELKNTINTMVDQLSSFADEVTRVAREVGTEGILGGQAEVKGVSAARGRT